MATTTTTNGGRGEQPCYTYLWSFAFSSYSSAQNAFLFHNWITGLLLPIATTIMAIFQGTVRRACRRTHLVDRTRCTMLSFARGMYYERCDHARNSIASLKFCLRIPVRHL